MSHLIRMFNFTLLPLWCVFLLRHFLVVFKHTVSQFDGLETYLKFHGITHCDKMFLLLKKLSIIYNFSHQKWLENRGIENIKNN